MARIGVVWFSYKPDGELLLQSVRSVKRTLEKAGHTMRLNVYEDGFYPLERSVREALAESGVEVWKTFYPRSGNLLGPENLKGQTKAMAATGWNCDALIKIDCDTLLLKCDWVEELVKDDEATMVGSYKGLKNYPMGNCYAVKGGVLGDLEKDCETYPAWAGCFEDYEVGTRLHRLADGDDNYTIRYRSGIDDGFWLCNPEQVNNMAKDARVVSCGFGQAGVPKDKFAEYKAAQLKVMKGLNDDIEGLYVKPETKNEEEE